MSYPTLSLERIVLTHLAASLWGPDDVWEISRAAWNGWSEKAENAVIELVAKKTLSPHLQALPTPLQDKITIILGPVGKQLADWVSYHIRFRGEPFALQSLRNPSWSPLGIIDKRAMAERWVTDERLWIGQRFQLACVYCLEPHIRSLWQHMPTDLKSYYCNAQAHKKINQDPLVQFWAHQLEGAWASLEDFFKKELFREERVDGKPLPNCSTPEGYAFWRAVRSGNPVATQYFLNQLSPEQKQRHLIPGIREAISKWSRYRWEYDFRDADYIEVGVRLLQCMDEAARLALFRQDMEENRGKILRCLLEWPWQSYFLDILSQVWEWMPKEIYASLIDSMSYRLTKPNGRLYRPILGAYWVCSPLDHRRQYLADSYHTGNLMGNLLKCRDLENAKCFLEEASLQEKEAIFLSYFKGFSCLPLIRQQDWSTLKWFIGLCLPSSQALLGAKECLDNYLVSSYRIEEKSSIWPPFFELLDRMASEQNYLPINKAIPERSVASEATDQISGMLETPPEQRSPLKRPSDPLEGISSPAKRRSFWPLSSPAAAENTIQGGNSKYSSSHR